MKKYTLITSFIFVLVLGGAFMFVSKKADAVTDSVLYTAAWVGVAVYGRLRRRLGGDFRCGCRRQKTGSRKRRRGEAKNRRRAGSATQASRRTQKAAGRDLSRRPCDVSW